VLPYGQTANQIINTELSKTLMARIFTKIVLVKASGGLAIEKIKTDMNQIS